MVYTVITSIAVAFIVLAGIVTQVQEIISVNAEITKETPKLEKLQQKLVELQEVQFLPEYAQVELVNSALPSKKPLLELLTSLQSITSVNSVTISDFELSPGDIATSSAVAEAKAVRKVRGSIDQLTISLSIEGAEANVRQFLTQLEKITPFTTITQLSVERVEARGDSELITKAKLTTDTYFFVKSVSATLEAPLPKIADKDREVLDSLASFVANDLPEQTTVTGGGLEDLFGVNPLVFEN